MVTREYSCPSDGVFFVKRPVSASLEEKCPKCNADATRSYLSGGMPVYGFTSDGIPNNTIDMKEYEGWQKDRWNRLESECNIDNMGTGYIDPTKIVGKRKFGQDS